jgi:hypothetical protein
MGRSALRSGPHFHIFFIISSLITFLPTFSALFATRFLFYHMLPLLPILFNFLNSILPFQDRQRHFDEHNTEAVEPIWSILAHEVCPS